MPGIITRITIGIHVPAAVAFVGAAESLSIPHPYLVGPLVAGLLIVPFFGRLSGLLWDGPRTTAQRLVDEPYYAHWCACLASAVPIALGCVVAPLVELARGLPVALPTSFALATYLTFFVIAAYGVLIRRRLVQLNRVDVGVDELPRGFEGYRIAQLSDLHIGGNTPKERASRWVEMANAESPDLTVVTGDLVTSGTRFHDDIAETLGKLRAKDGVIVSMGNHDYFGEGDPLIEKLRAQGLTVLRNETKVVARGEERLTIAACDDTWTRRADVKKTLAGVAPTDKVVLLAHDPDLFAQAEERHVDVVLSGHTHGGQIAVPFLARWLNLSMLVHRHTIGLYRRGRTTQYVHAGLGTTGPPIRLGAAPEVAIVKLHRR